MLREVLISLRTRCAAPLVALGYRYAAVACVSRAERCRRAWAPHQQNSRIAVLSALRDVPADRDTALILGSGPCLDLPMPELLARFKRVILVDVAHPPAARRWARRHADIVLHEADLTGLAAALIDPVGSAPPVPQCTLFADRSDIGLVVSVNLLSQLPLVPLRHVAKRWSSIDKNAYAAEIIHAHLDHLHRFACPTLLIGDVERRVLDAEGNVSALEDPLWGVSLPDGPEWSWPVAPVGELSGNWSIVNRVRAVRLDR